MIEEIRKRPLIFICISPLIFTCFSISADYPKLESEAKKVSEELGNNSLWSEVSFREAAEEDEEIIRLALESENAIHGNRDWAVKMGINLFYSANLSRNPLYSKQMHYNSVIYGAFGRSSPVDSSVEADDVEVRGLGRQKKIIVAGKWCGKVWMSNNKVAPNKSKARDEEGEYECDMEGCAMSFRSKQELALHKRNICPVKDCGKKFFSHKYLVQHRRVHVDDRPLKCPWKGCKMTFKWAWARTEHIRVHTGERPYVCTEAGCGQTFRFVSDFSRHKRKTGHSPKKTKG